VIRAAIATSNIQFRRRFNFKKANWKGFVDEVDEKLRHITPTFQNYETFIEIIKKSSRRYIPIRCRTAFIPGMKKSLQSRLQEYERKYNEDPFSAETIEVGDTLLQEITEERRKKWKNTVEELDMKTNSNKAWRLIRKLNCEKRKEPTYTNVTANEIASQLLLNSKSVKLK